MLKSHFLLEKIVDLVRYSIILSYLGQYIDIVYIPSHKFPKFQTLLTSVVYMTERQNLYERAALEMSYRAMYLVLFFSEPFESYSWTEQF